MEVESSKVLYSSFSSFRAIKGALIKVFAAFVLFVIWDQSSLDFNLITIGFALILIVALIVDQEELLVYPDYLRIRRNLLFGLTGLNTDIYYDKIDSIILAGRFTLRADIEEDLLSTVISTHQVANRITIMKPSGGEVTFKVYIYLEKIVPAIEVMKSKGVKVLVE